jgi:hypothetical protein
MSGTAVWFPGNNRVRVRSERVDRGFAYIGETGRTCGMWLCGITRIAKRYSIAVAVHNPGLLMRKLCGCCRLRTVSATRCTKPVRPPQVIPETDQQHEGSRESADARPRLPLLNRPSAPCSTGHRRSRFVTIMHVTQTA